MPNDDLARMYDLLRNNYVPGDNSQTGYDPNNPEEILRRRRRGMMSPVSNPYTINFQQPQQPQDNGMASDIFSAIGGGIPQGGGTYGMLGGIIPNILSAIFKKRS